MAKELKELTEESLYCDGDNYRGDKWKIKALSIDRNSDLYRKIVNDSLPFYFINQYEDTLLRESYFSYENKLMFLFGVSIDDYYDYDCDCFNYRLTSCFAHAIDHRYAKNGKLLPGAILPVLHYHANCNNRLYPGRVLTVDHDYDGDIECYGDQNEVVLVIGTTEDVIHVHGNITTKSLVVLGCTLIVDGDIHASDHIYAYGLGLKANSITGKDDAICFSLFDTAQPYDVGPHSTLATDPDTNPRIGHGYVRQTFECLKAAGWISTELRERCLQEDNLKKILEAATIRSKLIENLFKQENEKRAAPEPESDVWSEQAKEVLQWLQHPATSFADLRQFAIVGRCGIELPPNDPALQEEFRFQLIAALMDPASRSKLEKAWQMCGKLVDHRSSASKAALPPSRPSAAAKPVSTDDFYEVVDDEQ